MLKAIQARTEANARPYLSSAHPTLSPDRLTAVPLVTGVQAVVTAVTHVAFPDAEVVVTLELVLGAEPAAREARGTVQLVREVVTVPAAVTAQLGADAVARGALELIRLGGGGEGRKCH